jgi:hypothetical protein
MLPSRPKENINLIYFLTHLCWILIFMIIIAAIFALLIIIDIWSLPEILHFNLLFFFLFIFVYSHVHTLFGSLLPPISHRLPLSPILPHFQAESVLPFKLFLLIYLFFVILLLIRKNWLNYSISKCTVSSMVNSAKYLRSGVSRIV